LSFSWPDYTKIMYGGQFVIVPIVQVKRIGHR